VNVIALFLHQGVQDFLPLLFVHFHNSLGVMIPELVGSSAAPGAGLATHFAVDKPWQGNG